MDRIEAERRVLAILGVARILWGVTTALGSARPLCTPTRWFGARRCGRGLRWTSSMLES